MQLFGNRCLYVQASQPLNDEKNIALKYLARKTQSGYFDVKTLPLRLPLTPHGQKESVCVCVHVYVCECECVHAQAFNTMCI